MNLFAKDMTGGQLSPRGPQSGDKWRGQVWSNRRSTSSMVPCHFTCSTFEMESIYKGRVRSPKSLEVNRAISAVENMESWGRLPLHTGPTYDMDAYMATLFGGQTWDLCWELGQAKKLARAQLSTQVQRISFAYYNQDSTFNDDYP